MTPTRGEIWVHYKTKGEYEVLGIGKFQMKDKILDMKGCVIYKALSDQKLWVRPLEDFVELVETSSGSLPRFSFVR